MVHHDDVAIGGAYDAVAETVTPIVEAVVQLNWADGYGVAADAADDAADAGAVGSLEEEGRSRSAAAVVAAAADQDLKAAEAGHRRRKAGCREVHHRGWRTPG